MKFIFRKKNIIRIPLIIFIILLLICLIIIYNLYPYQYQYPYPYSYTEKFTDSMGEYEYMAPPTDNISEEMWKILFNKMRDTGANKEDTKEDTKDEKDKDENEDEDEDLKIDTLKKKFTNFITKEEIIYYVDNGIFPWNQYMKKLFLDSMKRNKIPKTINIDDLLKEEMEQLPNRYAYSQYLLSPNMKESLTSEAYLIYSG
jgi:hypothetical protein